MAHVYKALRIDSRGFSRQPVAIKVLKSQTQVPFLVQEMQALMNVRSAHCVSFLGWENLPEGPAIVMEWVEGLNLEELHRVGPLPRNVVCEIVAQIQAGLRDLELAGRCHGDLSASNILIDTAGTVKLVDFGVSGQPPEGQIIGTPQFMAPERWNGAPPSVASDLFSLGLLEGDLLASDVCKQASVSYWRERSERAADSGPSLLRRVPASRLPSGELSVPERRRELAELVQAARAQKAAMARTLVNESDRGARAPERIRGSCRALAVVFTLFVYPIAPFGEVTRVSPQPSASLEVRTHTWIRVRLGFIDLGYSPLIRAGIPAGLHRISWSSSQGSGSAVISLSYGEKKILTDKDFAPSAR